MFLAPVGYRAELEPELQGGAKAGRRSRGCRGQVVVGISAEATTSTPPPSLPILESKTRGFFLPLSVLNGWGEEILLDVSKYSNKVGLFGF